MMFILQVRITLDVLIERWNRRIDWKKDREKQNHNLWRISTESEISGSYGGECENYSLLVQIAV
jgi:hypothetical protein